MLSSGELHSNYLKRKRRLKCSYTPQTYSGLCYTHTHCVCEREGVAFEGGFSALVGTFASYSRHWTRHGQALHKYMPTNTHLLSLSYSHSFLYQPYHFIHLPFDCNHQKLFLIFTKVKIWNEDVYFDHVAYLRSSMSCHFVHLRLIAGLLVRFLRACLLLIVFFH